MIKTYPLVSIAIVTYNQKIFLRECILSCLSQDYKNLEIIISDDGSTDGTDQLLNEFRRYNNVVISLSNNNNGISKNFNRAINLCKGDWIKPIAGDDKLVPDAISKYMSFASSDNFDLIFANCIKFSADASYSDIVKPNKDFFHLNPEEQFKSLLLSNKLNAPASFIKKTSFDVAGYADEKFYMLEDYPLWLKFSKFKLKYGYLNDDLVLYRVGESTYNNQEKITNIHYLRSLFNFQKTEIWPHLDNRYFLKKIDDWAFYTVRNLGFKFFNNRKSFSYKLFSLLFLPLRVYSVVNLIHCFIKRNKKNAC